MSKSTMLSALKKIEENLAVLYKHINTDAATADSDETEDVKLTPIQKLEKRMKAATDKLEALASKKVTAKTNAEKDAETKAKLEETIEEIRKKISEAEKPAAKPAKAAKTEAETPAAKNIPKVTVALRTRLEKSFKEADIHWDVSHTEEYIKEMNALSKEEYTSTTEADRMSAFAKTKSSGAAGGAIKTLSLSELKKQNSDLTKVSPGVYRNEKTKEIVTGPEEDSDEGLDDGEANGVKYSIGETTQRVYLSSTEEFMGYWGVGEFYDLDI